MALSRRGLIDLVIGAAVSRNETPVPRKYIQAALKRINDGKERNVYRYPSGLPSPRGVHKVAARLEAEAQSKHSNRP